jgi:hypothetical protein
LPPGFQPLQQVRVRCEHMHMNQTYASR